MRTQETPAGTGLLVEQNASMLASVGQLLACETGNVVKPVERLARCAANQKYAGLPRGSIANLSEQRT